MKAYLHICIIAILMLLIYGFILPYLISQPSDLHFWCGVALALASFPMFYNMAYKLLKGENKR